MSPLHWVPTLQAEEGQDLTEYALIIGLVVILAVGAVTIMSDSIIGTLSSISSTLAGVL